MHKEKRKKKHDELSANILFTKAKKKRINCRDKKKSCEKTTNDWQIDNRNVLYNMYATMKIYIYYYINCVVLRAPEKKYPPRNSKTKISQISCGYRGIITILFWNDRKIIRKSIYAFFTIVPRHIERKAESRQKLKRDREREYVCVCVWARVYYVWKIRAVGVFRVYISQRKIYTLHTHSNKHT